MTDFEKFMKTEMLPAEYDDERVKVGLRLAYEAGMKEAAEIAMKHATKMQHNNHVSKRIAEAEELGARRIAAAIREKIK